MFLNNWLQTIQKQHFRLYKIGSNTYFQLSKNFSKQLQAPSRKWDSASRSISRIDFENSLMQFDYLQSYSDRVLHTLFDERHSFVFLFCCKNWTWSSRFKKFHILRKSQQFQNLLNMLNKIFIVIFLILNTESKAIIKANEKNFPSFVSLTDGKELLINLHLTAPSFSEGSRI